MKEISNRLDSEEWHVIDVILREFGLPWSDAYQGTQAAYLLEMLRQGTDEQLSSLAQHVGFGADGGVSPRREDPSFWRSGLLKVFVSHLATHREYAEELQAELVGYGISCFIAHNDIEPTQEWQTQIETALATCDALVALLHKDFHTSNWTDQEIGFAMGRGVPVYSVRFGQDPYGFVGRFQAFNGNNKSPKMVAKELFDAYLKSKQLQGRMGEVLVTLFEESRSFAAAKDHIGYLEDLETWDAAFSKRITTAVKNNGQVSGSFGVPKRVDALVKLWKKAK